MKNNIREILDKTDINVLDEINILEYIDELEQVKEDSLDKLDVLENRIDKAIEYLEDKNNEVIGILENNKDTFVKKQDLLNILRGEDNDYNKL